MEKHTICSAAREIIKKNQKPMTALEIYDLIVREKLYAFKAKQPLAILKSTLRKHTEGVASGAKMGIPYFKMDESGRYHLLK